VAYVERKRKGIDDEGERKEEFVTMFNVVIDD
jgi:hypothetical protein